MQLSETEKTVRYKGIELVLDEKFPESDESVYLINPIASMDEETRGLLERLLTVLGGVVQYKGSPW